MCKVFLCLIMALGVMVSAYGVSATGYGPTTPTDTLWHIASQIQVSNSNASIQQIMLALLKANQQAFVENNVNTLESGIVLKIPCSDKFFIISKKQADKIVEQQDRQWHKAHLKASKNKNKHDISHKPIILQSTKIPVANQSVSNQIQIEQNKPAINSQADVNQNKSVPSQAISKSDLDQNKPISNQVLANQSDLNQTKLIINQIEASQVDANQSVNPAVPSANPLDPNSEALEQPNPVPAPEPTFVADMNNRLSAIETKNDFIQNQLNQLGDRISAVEENLQVLEQQFQAEQQKKLSWWDKFIQQYPRVNKIISYLGMGTIVIVVLLLIVLYVRYRKHMSNANNSESTDDSYFTHVGDEASTTAKLNLARAYIDMGKETEAQTMLDEVVLKGNAAEQEEAKTLMEKMVQKNLSF